MKSTTDAKDMALISETDKRRDKQLDKKRSDALNTGQKTLRALNDQLKKAEKIVKESEQAEQAEWEQHPQYHGTYSAEHRIMSELFKSYSQRFISVCHAFSDASMGSKAALEQKVKRIFRLVDSSKTEEQLDQMLAANGTQMMQQMILSSKTQCDEIMQNAIEKRDACIKINETSQEILQLTNDFAALVNQQSQQIDRIETHVLEARNDVQEGIEHLTKANQHAKGAKRATCCGLCIFSIIAVVILLIVMGILRT